MNCFNSVVLDLLDLLLLWFGLLIRFGFVICILYYCVVLVILLAFMVCLAVACYILLFDLLRYLCFYVVSGVSLCVSLWLVFLAGYLVVGSWCCVIVVCVFIELAGFDIAGRECAILIVLF